MTFLCHYKTRSHLNAFRTKHKGCCNSSSVCNASCRDHRNIHRITNLRDKGHCRTFSDMPARLIALCHNCICSALFHPFCHCNRCNNRNDPNILFFPKRHVLFRISRTCCDNRHTFPRHCPRYFICVRAHQHDIDTKGSVRPFSDLSDLLCNPFCRCIRCTDHSQSSAI